MAFNIGSQTAGVINNVEGEQRIEGGQHTAQPAIDLSRLLDDLERALSRVDLPSNELAQARDHVQGLRREAEAETPRPGVMRKRLEQLASFLTSIGVIVTQGTVIGAPLAALAGWLKAAH